MTAPSDREIRTIHIAPSTWLGRLLVTVVAIALIFLAVFFFTLFLAGFFFFVIFAMARIFWAQRQGRRKGAEHVISAEYSVEKPEVEPQQRATTSKKQLLASDDYKKQ